MNRRLYVRNEAQAARLWHGSPEAQSHFATSLRRCFHAVPSKQKANREVPRASPSLLICPIYVRVVVCDGMAGLKYTQIDTAHQAISAFETVGWDGLES